MSQHRKLVPFSWLPGAWGLHGKTREIAEAEYHLTGIELERRILEIKKDEFESDEYTKKCWDLELKHGILSQEKYNRLIVSQIKDEKQKKLSEVELDLQEGKLTETEYAKKVATLNNEPWVTVLSLSFDGNNSKEGSFELDWNEQFIEKLKEDGYDGHTPDNIINQWFMTVCRNIALEEFDGTGDFTADSQANLDAYKRWNGPEHDVNGRKGYR